MPRKKLPPRLYQRPRTGEWVIRDGRKDTWAGTRTERDSEPPEEALEALSRYIAAKIDSDPAPRPPKGLNLGMVLNIYAQEHGPTVAAPKTLGYSIRALAPFWADLSASDVRGATCRRYAKTRPSESTARRELVVLQAALNHAHREGRLTQSVKVTLPPSAPPRERWLTRAEIRRVLRVASPQLSRLVIISVLTGTRLGAAVALRWDPSLSSGYVDLNRGILHRRGRLERETDKRREAVAMPHTLWRLMRRWERGRTVTGFAAVKTAQKHWTAACERAGVQDARLHDLKHTAVTWAFQKGMTLEGASGYFSTSQVTLERVYRHHSPHYQETEREIMGRRR